MEKQFRLSGCADVAVFLPSPLSPFYLTILYFLARLLGGVGVGAVSPRIQRPHDANARQHSVAAMLGDQHQRLDRRELCRRIVLALVQLRDVVAGTAQLRRSPPSGRGMGSSKVRDQPWPDIRLARQTRPWLVSVAK
jgi:hypothetical protein